MVERAQARVSSYLEEALEDACFVFYNVQAFLTNLKRLLTFVSFLIFFLSIYFTFFLLNHSLGIEE